ncbi:hypothetical protein VCHE45_2631 [Vibrio cholerae HE-45]|nr:hypothetical protein VCHE45_2631 [Vibrio cholerae HE-45]
MGIKFTALSVELIFNYTQTYANISKIKKLWLASQFQTKHG